MLYSEDDVAITTHSMIKSMRRCPRQAMYKYKDRLKPRSVGRPLQMGKWMHWLLETHYSGGDWKETHRELCLKYSELFDEEKEALGNLPVDCADLMRAYLWHYAADHWRVLQVEFRVQTRWPDGSIYRGKCDMLIEDEFGLWIVDHKNHKRLPSADFRMLDTQSPLYVWAARKGDPEAGIEPIPVKGFIWNYIKTAPQGRPTLLKDGSRLSKKMGDTTLPTYVRELKRLGLDPRAEEYAPTIARLRGDRYAPSQVQTSRFFERHVLERDDAMLARAAAEAYRTHRRLHTAGQFSDRDAVERVPDYKGCAFSCSYQRICQTELMGGITGNIVRQDYKIGDPLSYHQDERELGN